MEELEIEDRGYVRRVNLNRPHAGNALFRNVLLQFGEKSGNAESDTKSGAKAFCGGVDLKEL